MSHQPAISPELVELVLEYAADIADGSVLPGRPLGKTSKVITFCENAFAQFFTAEFGHQVTGFSLRNKHEAVALRRGARDKSTETVQIVTLFESFCNDFPDIMGAGYGGGMLAWNRLHKRLLPRFLDRLNLWAVSRRDLELAVPLQTALGQYNKAIKEAGW